MNRAAGLDTLKAQVLASIDRDIKRFEDRIWRFDEIAIPGMAGHFSTGDIGVVGGLALIIVGFWLLSNLINERDSLIRFLAADKDEQTGQWRLHAQPHFFTKDEIRNAYDPVANAFVFAPPRRAVFIDAFIYLSHLFPVTLMAVTVGRDFIDLYEKGLMHWHLVRWIVSAGLGMVVACIWLTCSIVSHTTLVVLRLWSKDVATQRDENPITSG